MQQSHDKNLVNNKRYNYGKVNDKGQALVSTLAAGGGERDAFGRLRVSQVSTQLDLKQIHDDLPLFFDTETIGTGASAHSTATASSTLTTAAASDRVIRQTKQRGNYQSGKGQQIFWTFANFENETNIVKRVGYYTGNTTTPFDSDKDGIYLESNSNGYELVVTRTGTETSRINSSAWDDKLDGTGSSGITIDWSKTNILLCSFEWLGVGSIEMSVVIDAIIYPFHVVKNANNLSDVYMSSPNQPVRYEIIQNGVGSGTFKQICSTIGSEGSINEIGKIIGDSNGNDFINANAIGTKYALMGLRLASDKVDTEVDILDFTSIALTNDSFLWEIYLNPTVAGTFNYSAISNSSIEVAKGDSVGNPSTNTVTGGTLLGSGYATGGGGVGGSADVKIANAIRLGQSIAGVSDTIVFCAVPLSINLDILASANWRERT